MQIPKLILFRKHLRSSAFWVTLWRVLPGQIHSWSMANHQKATCRY